MMKTEIYSDLNQLSGSQRIMRNLGLLALVYMGYSFYRKSAQKRAERKAWPKAFSVDPEGRPRDRVDEASWESFPASDPPGWR
jgi:hypothetical protein